MGKNCKLSGATYAPVIADTLFDIMFLHVKSGKLYDSLPSGTADEGTSAETRMNKVDWNAAYIK